ncbi:MAG: LytR C-terminal domain-containing protein [Candidatus Magasanikbacteria bacterium]|nr:LytR C-terminal domain-containing protein [Candidatus Magasanikbacteria bacterium]MCA9390816.1 LytR C-terminal domain-containing protein [Candidatus Magasanikbacteria bacterium]USN52482.1 MAG: LytR C-terminal domain-containing protein [Candidatus Nomurabacteria bacterium]HPF95494.1 LytR C-terminal domain-containing protein [bacterium]
MTKRAPSAAKAASPAVQEASRAARALPFLLALLVLILIGAYAYKSKNTNVRIGTNNAQVAQGDAREIQQLIESVSSFVVVSKDEIPSVATIEDIGLVRAQNPILYRGAENGDRLLVWSDKAVVYSVSQKKVLSVMPLIKDQDDIQYVERLISTLNANQGSVATSSTAATSETVNKNPTVEVRNGTPTPGRARITADSLKAAGFNTVAPVDASKKDYTKTVIFVAGANIQADIVEKLQKELNADIVTSLSGEAAITSDIVVVIGG